jgi:hypothetical protein
MFIKQVLIYSRRIIKQTEFNYNQLGGLYSINIVRYLMHGKK